MTTPPFSNRLIHEKSPYLLQHAHQKIDWFPWGQEAFDQAKLHNKPVFLSIGYATCHWCHVMCRESFEDGEVARLMNEAFINIKVDREERPDVDGMYMEFAQGLMSSAGGWPLNVILTPDLKPFFAVTYLPPNNRRGVIGMKQFIRHINRLWEGEDREEIVAQADKIVEIFQRSPEQSEEELPTQEHVNLAVEILYQLFDPVYGGLKGEPKFPMSYQMQFLLEFGRRNRDSRALFCVELSLDWMCRGGIYDQIGGGFSRYSVDERWVIPHFEKMLYDNAILSVTYLQAGRHYKKEQFLEVARETLEYLTEKMKSPEGGFFSAEDADSGGCEGGYYTWTLFEIREFLDSKEGEIFSLFYGVSQEGNFEGRNVLHQVMKREEFAEARGLSVEELSFILKRAKGLLYQQRQFRSPPFKDDKQLVSWNGLVIDAMARGGAFFECPKYTAAAVRAAEFIESHLWKNGALLHRFREGEARFVGGLDDYAFLIKGVLTLFEEGCGSRWLKWAIELSEVLFSQFHSEGGGFYYHVEDPSLLLRRIEFYDGAEPSGNGVHCENLLRLYQITREKRYHLAAEEILKGAKSQIQSYPPGACYHLLALQRELDRKAPTVIIALDREKSLEKEIKKALSQRVNPHTCVIWKEEGDLILQQCVPSLMDKNVVDGQTAVYLCEQNQCALPLIEKGEILKALYQM